MTKENVIETNTQSHSDQSHVPVHATRGTGWKIAITAILFAGLLVVGYIYGLRVRHNEDTAIKQAAVEVAETPDTVAVVPVERASVRKLLGLPGETRAFNETIVYARTSGYIKELKVDIGDRVKQGQTLAIIDAPELDAQLIAAKAKVAQAKSNANLAQAAANFAKLTYDRWEAAAPDGVVSEQERDQKKAELETAQARVAAAKSEIASDDAELSRLQTLVDFKNVTAPFDGTITQRHVDIGDLVTAGSSSNTTSLFQLESSDKLRIFVEVPQGASPEIKDQMPATVTASEYPDRTFTGVVDRTADSIDRNSRTLRVEVLVPNSDFTLKPGQYVQVAFQTDRRNPPLEIPAAALVLKPDGPEVAVVAADGTVKFRQIKIGRDLGDKLEIASGLELGDRVALNISSDVTDGEKVLVHDSTISPHSAQATKTQENHPENVSKGDAEAKRASTQQPGEN